MSPFEQFLLTYKLLPRQIIRLDADLFRILEELATSQGESVSVLVSELLYTVINENSAQVKIDRKWQTLTHREQQVAALTCLGYTNNEIASQLVISVNTVRSHMRNLLGKYHVSSKADLRLILAGWDFQDWLESQTDVMNR
jgi:DNA-binding CsgD family transcriptional regulator